MTAAVNILGTYLLCTKPCATGSPSIITDTPQWQLYKVGDEVTETLSNLPKAM